MTICSQFSVSRREWLLAALLLGIATTFSPASAVADDWPQWRGPTRDGVWKETGIVEKLPGPRIPLKWRVPISGGYTGPTVADGRVYVMDRLTEPGEQERILCFAWETGKELWKHAYDCAYQVQYTAGPRAAVSIDEGRAYALGTMGNFHCLDAATGKVHWAKDLRAEYKARVPVWGVAAAPLVDGGLVILQAGGRDGACLLALDKKTGKEVWRALDDQPSYSAPIIIEQAGRRVLVVWTGDSVAGLDPATGKVYWKYPFPPKRMVINVPTPVVDGDRLFVTAFYDGSLLLRLRQDEPAVETGLAAHRGERDEDRRPALHDLHAAPGKRLHLRRGQLRRAPLPGRQDRRPRLGEPCRDAQGPLVQHPHGPQRAADLDVQRAGRARHQRAFAAGFPRVEPREADRSDQRAIGAAGRRLLVPPGVCQ